MKKLLIVAMTLVAAVSLSACEHGKGKGKGKGVVETNG